MDDELTRAFRSSVTPESPDPSEAAKGAALPEWRGTGLCLAAQADGVPCTETGRSCEICGRASRELVPGSGVQPGPPDSPQKPPSDLQKRENDSPGPFRLDRAGL